MVPCSISFPIGLLKLLVVTWRIGCAPIVAADFVDVVAAVAGVGVGAEEIPSEGSFGFAIGWRSGKPGVVGSWGMGTLGGASFRLVMNSLFVTYSTIFGIPDNLGPSIHSWSSSPVISLSCFSLIIFVALESCGILLSN